MTDIGTTAKPLTGRHVAMIFAGAFSVIIAVNVTLAVNAVRTFPGLEVKNSYVASQSFDADRAAQEALGWDVTAIYADGQLSVRFVGAEGPVRPEITKVSLGRATERRHDQTPVLTYEGAEFTAHVGDLDPGKWDLRIEAVAPDGTPFKQRIVIWNAG